MSCYARTVDARLTNREPPTKPLAITRYETQFVFDHFPVEVPFGMTSREARFKARIERLKASIYTLVWLKFYRTARAAAAYKEFCSSRRHDYDGPDAAAIRKEHEDLIARTPS